MLAKYKVSPAQLLGLAPICAIHRRGAPSAQKESRRRWKLVGEMQ
jgi:hypothetical protein